MKLWKIIVHASEEIEVEAGTEDEAKELAAEQSHFRAVDYCEAEELEYER